MLRKEFSTFSMYCNHPLSLLNIFLLVDLYLREDLRESLRTPGHLWTIRAILAFPRRESERGRSHILQSGLGN